MESVTVASLLHRGLGFSEFLPGTDPCRKDVDFYFFPCRKSVLLQLL